MATRSASRCALSGVVLAVSVAASICVNCGPGWKVVKSSGKPSAIRGEKKLAVVPDYSAMLVTVGLGWPQKPEEEFAHHLPEADRASFKAGRLGMHAKVIEKARAGLPGYEVVDASGTEPAPDVVRVTVAYLLVGIGVRVVGAPSIKARLAFWRGGEMLDEIEVLVSANPYVAEIEDRLKMCAEEVGEKLAKFVKRANK